MLPKQQQKIHQEIQKQKVVTSKITTTVQTTTTQQVSIDNETAVSTTTSSGASAAKVTAAASSSQNQSKHEENVASVAGKMDNHVIAAYQQLGFKLVVDPSVNYSGYFDARSRSITMKQIDDSVYHELGHFLAFIAGNADKTQASFPEHFCS